MTTYTAENFLSSSRFLEVATEDAVRLVAKTNGQTYALTLRALAQQVPNVVREVTKLISAAAELCAKEAASMMTMKPTMPDFNNMTAPELSVWYIENVGYDIGAEDPSMSLERYRELCAELYELHNEAAE